MTGTPADAPIARLAASLDTARLTVRLVEPRDLDGLLAVHADDEVTRYLPYATWRSPDDARAWYERIARLQAEGRSRQYVVVERADERPVGAAVVFDADLQNRRCELGYVLGRRDWGRGLMREALTALVPRVFADLDMRRIEAHVDPRNAASHRLLVALGFRHEGLLRARSVVKGEVVDSNVYGLLRAEWAGPSVER